MISKPCFKCGFVNPNFTDRICPICKHPYYEEVLTDIQKINRMGIKKDTKASTNKRTACGDLIERYGEEFLMK